MSHSFLKLVLIQQLINHLSHNSFLAVVGASGSGKSSVVKAGLIAQLHQGKQLLSDKWLIKTICPGANPLDALVRKLGEGGYFDFAQYPKGSRNASPSLILEGMLYQGVEGFVYWLRSRPEPMVVLVIDQFEELFTLCENQDRQQFLELLLGALKYASDKCKVVITLRADFIAPCLEIPDLARLLPVLYEKYR